MRVRVVEDLADVDPVAWDALTGEDDPFVEHRFLHALEASGSVGEKAGWLPTHVTVWDGERLVAALPLYAKDHSYGEYIFDWGWADAARRLGSPYYPKLVSMVPVTPATGRRLLVADDLDAPARAAALEALVAGAHAVADATGASSIHLLFLREEERDALAFEPRLVARLTHQFHWTNEGYRDFDDFLDRFRSAMRKQVRKERRRVEESDLVVEVKEGPELDDADWHALHRFYRDTCERKGSYPYLTRRFFHEVRERVAERVVAALAYDGGRPVAGSLNFEKGRVLYGRYWGAAAEYDSLHFELCYYQLIERAIARGHVRFEAGAQGSHKLRRGLLPRPIHSLHWLRDPRLARAVAEFLPREAAHTERAMAELAEHGPFRRGENEADG